MILVLDSSVICSDFWFQRSSFRILVGNMKRANLSLCIPRLVVDEVINKYREITESEYRTLAITIDKLRQLLNSDVEVPIIESRAKQAADEYGKWIHATLKQLRANILDYPQLSHESLVRRALLRKKPFSDKGVGYRDALIWEVVLQLARDEPDQIAFVSMNVKDFADKVEKDRLHSDLAADLASSGVDAVKVSYFHTVERFVETIVKPLLNKLDAVQAQIAERRYPELDLVEWTHDNRATFRDNSFFVCPFDGFDYPQEVDGFHINSVESIHRVDVVDVRESASGEIVIVGEADADCEFRLLSWQYGDLTRTVSPFAWSWKSGSHENEAFEKRAATIVFLATFDTLRKRVTASQVIGMKESTRGPERR